MMDGCRSRTQFLAIPFRTFTILTPHDPRSEESLPADGGAVVADSSQLRGRETFSILSKRLLFLPPIPLGPGILNISWSHLTFWMRWPRWEQRERSRVVQLYFRERMTLKLMADSGDSERRVRFENEKAPGPSPSPSPSPCRDLHISGTRRMQVETSSCRTISSIIS